MSRGNHPAASIAPTEHSVRQFRSMPNSSSPRQAGERQNRSTPPSVTFVSESRSDFKSPSQGEVAKISSCSSLSPLRTNVRLSGPARPSHRVRRQSDAVSMVQLFPNVSAFMEPKESDCTNPVYPGTRKKLSHPPVNATDGERPDRESTENLGTMCEIGV